MSVLNIMMRLLQMYWVRFQLRYWRPNSYGLKFYDKHVEIQGKIPPTGFCFQKAKATVAIYYWCKVRICTTGFSTPFFHINALTLKIKAKLTDDEWQVDSKGTDTNCIILKCPLDLKAHFSNHFEPMITCVPEMLTY